MKIRGVDKNYDSWVSRIAKFRNLKGLVKHLREHIGPHYDRYDRTKRENLDLWLVDVINFLHILERKKLNINKEDMLFKLALHYKRTKEGPKPDFDVNEFIENYKGRFNKFKAKALSR